MLAHRQHCRTLGLNFPLWHEDTEATAGAIVEGIELGLHQDTRFKSEPKERSLVEIQLLSLAGQEAAIERSQRYLDRVELVLVEERNTKNPDQVLGRTGGNRLTFFNGDIEELRGQVVPVKISEVRAFSLTGDMVTKLD